MKEAQKLYELLNTGSFVDCVLCTTLILIYYFLFLLYLVMGSGPGSKSWVQVPFLSFGLGLGTKTAKFLDLGAPIWSNNCN